MVADWDELGFPVIDQWKNRKSHISQRNGRTKTIARIARSTMPLRLDRRICSLLQIGQFTIANLLSPNPILRHGNSYYLSRFEHKRLNQSEALLCRWPLTGMFLRHNIDSKTFSKRSGHR